MPRPKVDKNKLRAQIIAEAEAMLAATAGRRLNLSEIAARVGMSQSYAHTFFPTKADLIRTLAQNWFAKIEALSAKAATSDAPPAQRLETWLLSILREKRARFDANPVLFRAYLDLAQDHMDLVQAHVATLMADLRAIVAEAVAPAEVDTAFARVADATLLFRTPQNIAQYRAAATDERAIAMCRFLTAAW